MLPEDRDPAYLWDMLEACRTVTEFMGNLTLEQFLAPGREGKMLRLAVERELEVLGEASRRISERFREEHLPGLTALLQTLVTPPSAD